MGVSWNHQVWFVCDKDESSYVKDLPEYLEGTVTDTPVYDKKVDGNVVYFESSGYNIYDLFGLEFPRPESWTQCIHRISPCQGQEFDVVDWIDRSEFDDKMSERDEDDIEWGYNPMNEYTDPGSEYWEENNHLNPYSQFDTKYREFMDTHDEDEEEDFYELFHEWVDQTQTTDVKKGLEMYTKTHKDT